MSNVKDQISNEFQMTKLKCMFGILALKFELNLTFACLPAGRDFDIRFLPMKSENFLLTFS
jgi:hypothetical protein